MVGCTQIDSVLISIHHVEKQVARLNLICIPGVSKMKYTNCYSGAT